MADSKWQFLTLNGQATEITSKGKQEHYQICHIDYEETDFIKRMYLLERLRQTLK